MSKILKSSQISVDKKTYKLSSFKSFKQNKETNDKVTINKEVDINSVNDFKKNKDNIIENLINEQLNKAKDEAERIISEAYEKSKSILEQSRIEGYEKGKLEGFKEGKKAADDIIQESLKIKEEVLKTKKKLIKDIEQKVVELTISTVEKVLNKKIEEEYDIILNLIQLGLEKCAFTDNLTLRVSPEDFDFAVSSKDKILALSENIEDIIIKQDKSLKKGSCVIDTSSGSIDSSIWTQFEQVKEIFDELLRSE